MSSTTDFVLKAYSHVDAKINNHLEVMHEVLGRSNQFNTGELLCNNISYNYNLLANRLIVCITHLLKCFGAITEQPVRTILYDFMAGPPLKNDQLRGIELLLQPESVPGVQDESTSGVGNTTLECFLNGHVDDKSEVKLHVLVLSIGHPIRDAVTTESKTSTESIDLAIIDHSCLQTATTATLIPARIFLPSTCLISATTLTPTSTTLSISSPKLVSSAQRRIELTPRSQILTAPESLESNLLRTWMRRLYPTIPLLSTDITATLHSQHDRLDEILHKQNQKILHRKQYTLSLFLEEVSLRKQRSANRPRYRNSPPTNPSFVGYISVIITKVSLSDLYLSNHLFCGCCPSCEIQVFANTPTTYHSCLTTNDTMAIDTDAEHHIPTIHNTNTPPKFHLAWNTTLLSGLSDETGGLILATPDQRHNLHLTEKAVLGLTGLKREDFEVQADDEQTNARVADQTIRSSNSAINGQKQDLLDRLYWIEEQLLWERVTLIVGWSVSQRIIGGGNKSGVFRNNHNVREEECVLCDDEEDIVVLEVLS